MGQFTGALQAAGLGPESMCLEGAWHALQRCLVGLQLAGPLPLLVRTSMLASLLWMLRNPLLAQVKCRDRKGLLSDIINALKTMALEVGVNPLTERVAQHA